MNAKKTFKFAMLMPLAITQLVLSGVFVIMGTLEMEITALVTLQYCSQFFTHPMGSST